MSALRHGIPRLLQNHRTPEGAAIGSYLRAQVNRYGLRATDPTIRPVLKELGRLALELDGLQAELDALRARKNPQKRPERLLKRDVARARFLLLRYEAQLAGYASSWDRKRIEADRRRAMRRAGA